MSNYPTEYLPKVHKNTDYYVERWQMFGISDDQWKYYEMLLNNNPVLLIAKGASFNKNFPFYLYKHHIKVCVCEAVKYVPEPDICLTIDGQIRTHLYQEGYKNIMIAAIKDGWYHPIGSGDYAFMLLGEMGVKAFTCVGFDACFHGDQRYGFDYESDHLCKAHPEKALRGLPILQSAIRYRIKEYGFIVNDLSESLYTTNKSKSSQVSR